ncbi:hypothetical protein Tco_0505179 [Tanacetum coccineum]
MPFIEEGGSVPKILNLKSFILPEGTLSQEKFMDQLKEMKRLADLKEQEKKSEEELKKLLNPATFKAQALKWEEHKEKKAKMLKEFNKCISERTSPLPITKISYVVNSSKTATMRITRDKDPLNLKVYPDFRHRMLGFSEWLEVYALASKKSGKSYDVLLQSLMAKFQWVLKQAKRLGLPPLPELATFGLTTEEKKRKRKVMKGLSECEASESNVIRIQVKDIVKEVKDYLKTYSSAGMDISWYVEGIRRSSKKSQRWQYSDYHVTL